MKPHPGMLLHVLTWVLRGPGVPGWSVPTWTPLTKGSLLAVPTVHAQSPRVTERFPNVGTSDTFVEVSFGGCQGAAERGDCPRSSYGNVPRSSTRTAPPPPAAVLLCWGCHSTADGLAQKTEIPRLVVGQARSHLSSMRVCLCPNSCLP